ncbi:MAG: hypothetical protein ACHQF2_00945 [Flavobacteriales bacterium]
MKKYSLLLLLSAIAFGALSQQKPDSAAADTQTVYFPHVPDLLRLGTGKPFFTWTERPDSFSFSMYNRWGELLAKSTDPDFIIDDILKKDKKLKKDVYVYKWEYVDKNGIRQKRYGHKTLLDDEE